MIQLTWSFLLVQSGTKYRMNQVLALNVDACYSTRNTYSAAKVMLTIDPIQDIDQYAYQPKESFVNAF